MRTFRMILLAAGLAACGGDAEPPQPQQQVQQPEPGDSLPPRADSALRELDIAEDSGLMELPPPARPSPTGSGGTATLPPRPTTPAATEPARPEPSPGTGQQDEGAAVLRSAATAYANVRSMRAEFVMTFSNRLLRTGMTGRGTLYQQRPDRIALRFTDPAGELILSDGEYFYIYQPGVNPNQAIRTRAGSGTGGVDLQAEFVGQPTERFSYTLEGREPVGGRQAHVLTLVPRERADYRSLKVWIDTRDFLARRFEIVEHNGSVRRFDLSGLQTNVQVAESVFRFVPPDGVRIIDP